MSQFETIKTQAGMGLEAAADTGGPSIKLVAMSVGDGNGQAVSVSTTQTGLVHEVDRVNLNQLRQNPSDATQWVAEAVFPADRGGYMVREVGLWTDGGVLFAVANFPDTYKPAPSEGTAGQLIIQLNFRAANSDNVTLAVDGNLQLATLDDLNAEIRRAKAAEGQLVSGVGGYSPGSGDLQIDSLFYQGSSGVPCATYLNAAGQRVYVAVVSTDRLTEILNGYQRAGNYQLAGDYATNGTVNAESMRAQNEERQLVSGVGGYSPGSGDLQIDSLFYQGSSGVPCATYLNAAGQRVYVSVVSSDRLVEILNGYQKAGNYQPAGDYATNATVNAESMRAQNAERQLVSGVGGAAIGNGDLQIDSLFYQGSSGIPCATYLNAAGRRVYVGVVSADRLTEILNGYQLAGDYATNATVNAESMRAQNAERQLVSGVGGAAIGNGDLQIDSLFYQGSSGVPCATYLNAAGQRVYVGVVSTDRLTEILNGYQRAGNYQLAGDYATNSTVNDGLNGKVNRAGDTITGPIVINAGNPLVPWAGSPQLQFFIGGAFASFWTQADADGNMRIILGGSNPGQPYRSWVFDPGRQTITSAGGNAIPEVVGMSGRVVDQVFVANGIQNNGPDGEAWVDFPIPFRDGTVPVVSLTINREPGLVSRGAALGNISNQNRPNVTNRGFSFQPWYATGGNIGASGQPWTLHVRVMGVM